MTKDSPELNELTAVELSNALKKLQEGEQTADEIEHKLDLMEQKMAQLLEQVELMQNDSNTIKISNSLLKRSSTFQCEQRHTSTFNDNPF